MSDRTPHAERRVSIPDHLWEAIDEMALQIGTDRDGLIRVPDRPGLGVTLNEEFVKRYLIAESR